MARTTAKAGGLALRRQNPRNRAAGLDSEGAIPLTLLRTVTESLAVSRILDSAPVCGIASISRVAWIRDSVTGHASPGNLARYQVECTNSDKEGRLVNRESK